MVNTQERFNLEQDKCSFVLDHSYFKFMLQMYLRSKLKTQ